MNTVDAEHLSFSVNKIDLLLLLRQSFVSIDHHEKNRPPA